MESSPTVNTLEQKKPEPFFSVMLPALIPGSIALVCVYPCFCQWFGQGNLNDLLVCFLLGLYVILGFLTSWSVYSGKSSAKILSFCFLLSLLIPLRVLFINGDRTPIETILPWPVLQLIALLSLVLSRPAPSESAEKRPVSEKEESLKDNDEFRKKADEAHGWDLPIWVFIGAALAVYVLSVSDFTTVLKSIPTMAGVSIGLLFLRGVAVPSVLMAKKGRK